MNGMTDAIEQARAELYKIERAAEGSAEIMRDSRRTGGWEGSAGTADQFARLSLYARRGREALDGLLAARDMGSRVAAPVADDVPGIDTKGASQ